ncbi:MAG: translation initiation factor IF-2 [Candidatus Melainabacteria bacterium]|nr:translation initiation factor IF-2 [Candidatus Melainabacteria bacterium]
MDDRVRIYELARKMNISNQDIITILRELGHDIKSHSSTIDKSAVSAVIAALGKKNQAAEPPAKDKKAAPKASSKIPAIPEKQIVKPRVLSRYRKPDPLVEGEAPAEGSLSPAAPQGTPITGQPPEQRSSILPAGGLTPLPASQISSTPRHPRPHLPTDGQPSRPADAGHPTQQPVQQQQPQQQQQQPAQQAQDQAQQPQQTSPKAQQTEATAAPATTDKEVEPQSKDQQNLAPEAVAQQEAEVEPPSGDSWSDASKFAPRAIRNLDQHFSAKQRKVEQEEAAEAAELAANNAKKAKLDKAKEDADKASAEAKNDTKNKDNDNDGEPSKKGIRPMSPSVPIRVAAPSMRATPPRPPKQHSRHSPARHQKKDEEKVTKQTATVSEVPKVVTIGGNLTVQELAERMQAPATEVIKRLFMKGVMRTVNQVVEAEVAKELAIEMEYEVLTEEVKKTENQTMKAERLGLNDEIESNLITRPPVVTIMGHVDHGKTSLLDAIRQTKLQLTAGEAGGITQHIGAYHVEVEHEEGVRQVVFLDTPGHEAFTAMRARGARVTDIAILVVAADDGVMPQTIEAIDHAKAAGVPIIVAVNKIDKADSDPDRVLSQLMEHDLLPDVFGGDTVTVKVSAKKRTGLDELLEMIILVADMQDLKANPDRAAKGVIVEAELSRGKGAVATALVQSGTLREGDYIVAGRIGGRVRALFDDRGHRVKAAGPSMPVEVLGLDEVPQAGDIFEVVEDIQMQKNLIEIRREQEVSQRQHHVSLESLHDLVERGEVKELNVIIKADVQGTAEAIADSVRKLSDEFVQIRVLRAASGEISENDVNLAASSEAIVIGFNSTPDPNASRVAEAQGVDVRSYSIIYQITDDLQKAMSGLLEPIKQEVKIGTAEIRVIFKVGKGLAIGGCMVLDGKIQRNCIARVERAGQVVHEGKIDTLKRFKDDVREVAAGFECGLSFEKFSDIQEGDKVNAYIIQEVKRDR